MSLELTQEEKEKKPFPRLGNCEVCSKVESKYTCPKCEVKTCSLKCVKVHKSEVKSIIPFKLHSLKFLITFQAPM